MNMTDTTLTAYALIVVAVAMLARFATVLTETVLHRTTLERAGALAGSGARGGVALQEVLHTRGWDRRVAACRTVLHSTEVAVCAVVGAGFAGRGGMVVAVVVHLAAAAIVERQARMLANRNNTRYTALAGMVGRVAVSLLPGRQVDPTSGGTKRSGSEIETQALRNVVDSARLDDVIDPVEHRLITAVMGLDARRVNDVMVPRHDVVCVEPEATLAEAYHLMLDARVSRAPIVTPDAVFVVHLKDVASVMREEPERMIISVAREALVVPETRPVRSLLQEMQTTRRHLAAVANEYGEFSGIVTFEDCIEELLGEIDDEHDEQPTNVVVADGRGRWMVRGSARIEVVNTTLGANFAEESVDTIGGLVFEVLGRVPENGDSIQVGEWTATVVETAGRRVLAVRLESAHH